MAEYETRTIEKKWQSKWAESGLYRADLNSSKPKWYFLLMFPYPSGPLHCGHWFAYGPPDTKARYLRMRGYEVLFPMGFDSFGLPAENAAIDRGIHPQVWTKKNIGQMRDSFASMGASFDPDRWIVTSDPQYYRWTQWLFLQMYKHDLAYRSFTSVDWCPSCNTTLAREQVVGDERLCDRCSTSVTKRDLNQWSFRITKYAEELLSFEGLDWPDRVKTMQTNWIGKSVGADIHFPSEHPDVEKIAVFTTRPDTVCGTTFVVLAPEHSSLAALTTEEHREEVEAYVEAANRATEIQRLAAGKEKTGVFLGSYVKNPVTGEAVPVYVGDYVVVQYGSGAVMGVPAHDQRDFEFAKKYDLPIRIVVTPADGDLELETAYTESGILRESGAFDGVESVAAKVQIADWLEEQNLGKSVVRYRLRDWGVSRQRYWGAPIPIIHCNECGIVPVPDDQLPIVLPEKVEFRPTGESPLKLDDTFRNVACPTCGGPAERDTDTMDTFVDSSWYWYRYLAAFDSERFSDPALEADWLPVAEYGGGIEHATMHMLYARFMAKALRDMGHVKDGEPFRRHVNQGLILGTDNEKMSKSRGNVVDPNDVVARYGSDVTRSFVMFLGPWGRGGTWSDEGITGLERFYRKVWKLVTEPIDADAAETADAKDLDELLRHVHVAIRKVGNDIENFAFNTAISALMEFVNFLAKAKPTALCQTPRWSEAMRTLVVLLAPIAPHITEELWEQLGEKESVHLQSWPVFEEALTAEDTFTLVAQVNGKIRERFEVPTSIDPEEAKKMAVESEAVQRDAEGKNIVKVIYVPGKLVNIVVK